MVGVNASGRRSHSRAVVFAAVACAVCTVAFTIALGLRVGGPRVTDWVDNIGESVAPLGAVAACLFASFKVPRYRLAWLSLAGFCFFWALGQLVWDYYDMLRGIEVPFPSLADAGYLGAVPFGIVGLLLLPGAPQWATSRVRGLLDGCLVAGSLFFFSWATVLGPVYRTSQGGALKQILSVAYPLGDVIMASIVVILIIRTARGVRMSLWLVMAGILAFALADSSFAYFTEVNKYGIGNVLDAGWVAGFLLIALGGLQAARTSDAPSPKAAQATLSRWTIITPYVPVVLAAEVAIARLINHEDFGLLLSLVGGAVVLVLSVRQVVLLFEGTAALKASEARYSALVRHSSDLVMVVGVDGSFQFESPSVHRILGRDRHDSSGHNFVDTLHPDDRSRWQAVVHRILANVDDEIVIEWRVHHADGTWRSLQSVITNLIGERSVAGLVINSRDVTEQKVMEEELRHQAFHDGLTGLANRAMFTEHLESAVRRRSRSGAALTMVFIDLDGFKAINDLRGHGFGDRVLMEIARRLGTTFRDADVLARLGGDEFAALLEGPIEQADLRVLGGRVIESFALPMRFGVIDVAVGASVGIAKDTGCESAEELLRNADVAMYAAKANGKGSYQIFSSEMHAGILDRMRLDVELRRALERNELSVHYQPVVDLSSGRVTGAEALVRWEHPLRGWIPPAEFIPVAESSDLILVIGNFVLRTACKQFANWHRSKLTDNNCRLSINLSARELAHPEFTAMVTRALESSGLEPRFLTLEVTESVILDHLEESRVQLQYLRAIGVSVAIDDFGTGYSSLSALRDLPVDTLKIDKSFVNDVVTNPSSARLAQTIIQLAQGLGLHTVAEGVEDEDQLQFLTSSGCDAVQGYYFARPMPGEAFAELVGHYLTSDSGVGTPAT